MIFCSRCFVDAELIALIEQSGRVGDCPICGSNGVSIYDTDKDFELRGIFDNVLSVYTAQNDLPLSYPPDDIHEIGTALISDWSIFGNIPESQATEIAKALSPDIAENYPQLFEQKVGILEKYDIEYLKKHSILHADNWSDFVEAIKHKNRFHTRLIDTELLKKYCIQIEKIIPVDNRRFYRGRIARDAVGFRPTEMGPPPVEYVGDGRANSAGISRLYLTDNRETTFHEIRAAEYDYVTIGTFKATEPIRVVDLKRIALISPFGNDVDCTALAINSDHLRRINEEMSKTMRRGDSPLDYLPTQYIADFVMSITDEDGKPMFDGIEYRSAMHSRGANLTIFYPQKFRCTYSRTYEVTQLSYQKKTLARHAK